jgi:hypothetical protein
MIRAVLWDFGGVITTSPFELFARYERDAGLPPDFIRRLNAENHHQNAWAKLERSEVELDEFCALYEAEATAAGHGLTVLSPTGTQDDYTAWMNVEDLLDLLALLQADFVARMSCGATINAAGALGVLGHVRRDIHPAHPIHEPFGVIPRVCSHRSAFTFSRGHQHLQRSLPLRGCGRCRHASRHWQAATVLHQSMTLVTEL